MILMYFPEHVFKIFGRLMIFLIFLNHLDLRQGRRKSFRSVVFWRVVMSARCAKSVNGISFGMVENYIIPDTRMMPVDPVPRRVLFPQAVCTDIGHFFARAIVGVLCLRPCSFSVGKNKYTGEIDWFSQAGNFSAHRSRCAPTGFFLSVRVLYLCLLF
eukprot:GEMP01082632.1.p1 GENE.GEMP01082632.1~~GEMP01082632.1.p1  ORF type:complete len:158 (+),score=0.34 GEMP01082632.1:343-816(+)